MGAFNDERQAIEAKLAAGFSALTIMFENTPIAQPVAGWVAITIIQAGAARISVGTTVKRHRYVGNIQIDIFLPERTGSKVARDHADTIEAVFRDQQFSAGNSGTITCRTPSIVPGGIENGFYRLILNIPYQRDKNF